MDILISGVPSIALTGKPKASSTAYALATAISFAFPYQKEPSELALELQARYNTTGDLTPANILDALSFYGVKHLDLQPLVDAGNFDDMRHEIGAEEKQGLIHLIILKNDSGLAIAVPLSTPDANGAVAVDGEKLHPWSKGVEYALVRVGFSDSSPWGYYKDAVLSALPYADFGDPTPVLWPTIAACGIAAIIGILPSTVAEAPPANFRYYGGGNGAPDNTWPAAQPDVTQVVTLMRDQIRNDRAAASQSIVAQLTASLVALDAAEDDTFSKTLFALSNGKVGAA